MTIKTFATRGSLGVLKPPFKHNLFPFHSSRHCRHRHLHTERNTVVFANQNACSAASVEPGLSQSELVKEGLLAKAQLCAGINFRGSGRRNLLIFNKATACASSKAKIKSTADTPGPKGTPQKLDVGVLCTPVPKTGRKTDRRM